MIDRDLLRQKGTEIGVTIGDAQVEQFDRYAQLLVEWNEKMNLTAITQPDEILCKHFVDSLTLLAAVELPQGARVADVGTGAGFPAIPLLIMRPDLQMTLIDSLQKRLRFLDEVLASLGLRADCLHMRAEDAGRETDLREEFDLVTARAVARMNALSEYCLPLVRVGGRFVAMKADADEEVREAKDAIQKLGGQIERIVPFDLTDVGKRTIVLVQKISQTPTSYPRKGTKITKNPL